LSLKLEPVNRLHSDVFDSLYGNIAPGNMYLTAPYVVPFSYYKTAFYLTVDTPGSAVRIQVSHRKWQGGDQKVNTYSVVPPIEETQIELYLGEGINDIFISSDVDGETQIRVASSHIATLLDAEAQELFNYTTVIIDETEIAILSPLSVKMVEHLLPFQDLLPDVQTYRSLCARLGVRSLFNEPGSERGVKDFTTALVANTPIIIKELNHAPEFEPLVYPLFTSLEQFGGWDFHVWLPNFCVARWLAFIRLANNVRDVYELLSVSELTVILNVGGFPERHQFSHDFSADECSLSSLVADCFDIRCSMVCDVLTQIKICIHYPFDLQVEQCMALGAGFFDCEEELDTDTSTVPANVQTMMMPAAGPGVHPPSFLPPDGIRNVFSNEWQLDPHEFLTQMGSPSYPITYGDLWLPSGSFPVILGYTKVHWIDTLGTARVMYDLPAGGWDPLSDGNPAGSAIDYGTGEIYIDTGFLGVLAGTTINFEFAPYWLNYDNTFDTTDPEAYTTSPGWVGLGLSGRFDHFYGSCLDTYPWVVTALPQHMACCFPYGHTVTCVGDEYAQVDIPVVITASGTLTEETIFGGPIIMPFGPY
jgi:hypothetical protein